VPVSWRRGRALGEPGSIVCCVTSGTENAGKRSEMGKTHRSGKGGVSPTLKVIVSWGELRGINIEGKLGREKNVAGVLATKKLGRGDNKGKM